ncbi:hypothetical protein [Haloprofundus salinisoli]|uniref:hypothetical protein n=1 Tax=Haloprofundus salinisoli TaxID=2876193 RepID=UPI001CCD9669|nr:hypothetical protein [Haloprofundus salinisoli]
MSTSNEGPAEREPDGVRDSEESKVGRTTSERGYVHRPNGEPSAEPEPAGFGDRGWALVAAVVLSFLVVPGVIYLVPSAPGELGLSFFAAMLALPLAPAVILGLTAVWSMTAATRGEN